MNNASRGVDGNGFNFMLWISIMKKYLKTLLKMPTYIKIMALVILLLAVVLLVSGMLQPKHSWKSGGTTVTFEKDGTLRVRASWGVAISSLDQNWFRALFYGDRVLDIPKVRWKGAMNDYTFKARQWNSITSSITNLVIEEGVTYIGVEAFASMSNLKSITIPNSVIKIGSNAFSHCTGLISITIPNSVTEIGYWAFYDCTSLKSIAIPSSVKSIRFGAFENCAGLTSVTIPSSVKSIGIRAFMNCTGLTSVTIMDGVEFIDYEAFAGCTSLTSIMIPGSVKSINDGAFENCTGLTSVTIMDGVESIGEKAFAGCTGLTSVTVPSSVMSVGDRAFPDGLFCRSGVTLAPRAEYEYVQEGSVWIVCTMIILMVCGFASWMYILLGFISKKIYRGEHKRTKIILKFMLMIFAFIATIFFLVIWYRMFDDSAFLNTHSRYDFSHMVILGGGCLATVMFIVIGFIMGKIYHEERRIAKTLLISLVFLFGVFWCWILGFLNFDFEDRFSYYDYNGAIIYGGIYLAVTMPLYYVFKKKIKRWSTAAILTTCHILIFTSLIIRGGL